MGGNASFISYPKRRIGEKEQLRIEARQILILVLYEISKEEFEEKKKGKNG